MTPNLLQIVEPPRAGAALLIEFPVNPATAPYLVSRATSKALTMWIPRASTNGNVRAAVRETTLEELYSEVVEQVVSRGREEGWENTHPLTKEGIVQAVEYIRYYGFTDDEIEVLAHPKLPWGDIDPSWKVPDGEYMVLGVHGFRVQPAAWLGTDTVVIAPRNRAFLGVVMKFDAGFVAVVHNPARGMAVATSK